MFDSHCHLDAPEYDGDRAQVIERARAAGMRGIVIPGSEPREWDDLRALCAQDPMLRYGLGVHPWYLHKLSQAELASALEGLPARLTEARCVAVGECGLDGSVARRGGADMETQTRVLEGQLDLARKLQLPVILHCVGAHGLLLDMLEARPPLPRGGVLHSYSGAAELVPRYAKVGLSFSFAGVLTREEAKKPRKALCSVPQDRLLVESDGPDQAARDSHCERSEPAHIRYVLRACAELREQPYEELVRLTTHNALSLFGMV